EENVRVRARRYPRIPQYPSIQYYAYRRPAGVAAEGDALVSGDHSQVNRTGAAVALLLTALWGASGVRAADYWAYSYKDIQVMAEGTQADAELLARRLGAFDESLRTLLRLPA